MSKSVLVIVAHPDDEVIGLGGTILKLQKEYGYKVHVEFMTYDYHPTKWKYALEVSKIIGTTLNFPVAKDFKPLNLNSVPISNLVDHINKALDFIKPDIVFTHHSGDLNQDHRAVSEAVLIATRPYPGQTVKRVYTFDTVSSTEWSFGEFSKFEPNVFIDISKYLSIKRKSLEVYKEEIKNLKFPHPRSIEGIEFNNKVKGSVVGLNSAETFRLVRSVDIL